MQLLKRESINEFDEKSECCDTDLDSKENIVSLKDVNFSYRRNSKPDLININLDIKKGEFIVLTGNSGCGKTTITRIINGLAVKFYNGILKGQVYNFTKDINEYKLHEIGQKVGSIFQDPKSQFFASTTEDEIAFGCENYGVPYDELKRRVFYAIKAINADNLKGRKIYPMSSGEKQKIAIASVNAVNPLIYVFDEPSANLDMKSVESLKDLMKRLKESGHTVIVAEHRLYYLMDLCDRFIYMNDGRLEREMTPEDLRELREEERIKMGLRSCNLNRIQLNIPKVNLESKKVLSVQNLKFSYKDKEIFNNISFEIYSGQITAICGKNGAGKTTLSEILCGIKKESDGKILYNNKKVSPRNRRNHAYFVMQNTDCALFGDSVYGELILNNKRAKEEQIDKILSEYNLISLKDKHPASLSGGQKQRLSIAVSDIIESEILILDEPTSGLDYKNMFKISKHLKDLAAKGKTILIITHDYEFAAMTCNNILHFTSKDKIEMIPIKNGNDKDKLLECMTNQ